MLPPLGERHDASCDNYLDIYREYRRIIDQNLLGEAIAEFRTRQVGSADVPDERIIDWLLWGWVAYLRSGAQYRGEALYV